MKLGLGTYALAWSIGVPGQAQPAQPLAALDFLETAIGYGFSLAQMADNLPVPSPQSEEGTTFLRRAKEAGVQLELGGRGMTEANLRRHFDWAEASGATLVRMVIDGPGYEPDLDQVLGIMQEALPELERRSLTLGIENHDRLSADTFVKLMDSMDSAHIGICLDTVNSFGSCEGPGEIVPQLAPYTVNLHIKDFSICRMSHNMGFHIWGTPAGNGMLNIPWLVEKVSRYGRCATAALELWPTPEADVAATVEKERRWVEESLRNLKPYFE